MKIALFGDIHLKAKKLGDVATAWKRMVEQATSRGCDYILQAGDVFDHANIFGKEATVGTIYDAFLKPFTGDKAPKLIVIIGNHDIGGPDNKDALVPVDHHTWISVYRAPSHISLDDKIGLVMLPWIDRATLMRSLARKGLSPEESRQKIDALISEKLVESMAGFAAEYKAQHKPVIFMSHIEVTGALMDSGMPQCGGMFELSPSALQKIGADVYALGHIHKRQHIVGLPRPNDGYLGAVCQTKFGEEENKTGGRFIEFANDGSIVCDEWIDDPVSPRYYTIESLFSSMSYRDVDYIKLRSEHRPDGLPAGFIFEKKIVKRTIQVNGKDVILDADSPLQQLLEEWGKRSGVTITKELLEIAKAMKISTSQAGIGSWDSLDKIILRNITCHKETDINLTGIKGVVGIEGPNGSGKTTAMESVVFSLYGESPRHSAEELISTMSNKAGLIEIHFTSSGKNYIARRELKGGKTVSHKAFLFEGQDNPIAGPNVSAVNNATSVLVGDKTLVLAGVFAAQSDSGNMVEISPSERKQLFAKLIGSDKFLEMSTQAKDSVKGVVATIAATESRITEIRSNICDEVELSTALETLRDSLEEKKTEIGEQQEKLEETNQDIQVAKNRETERIAINSKIAEAEKKKKETEEEARTLKNEWNLLLKVDQKKADDDLQKAKDALDRLQKAKDEVSKVAQERANLVAEAARLKAEASTLKAERMKAYSKAVQDNSKRQKEIRESRQPVLDKILTLLKELSEKVSTLTSEVSESCRKVELIKGFPDLPACQTCVLSEDCVKAKNGLPDKKKELDTLKERIGKGEKKRDEYIAATEKLLGEALEPDEETFQEDVLEKIATLIEKANKTDLQAKNKNAAPELLSLIARQEKLATELKTAEEAIETARTASSRIKTITALIEKLRGIHKGLTEEIQNLRDSAPAPIDLISLKAIQNELIEAIKGLNEAINKVSVDIGKQQAKIEENDQRIIELKKLLDSIAPQKLDIDNLMILATAFGRDGIPQMLVERTIPRFEEIMNDLVSEFECGMEIKVISQRATKKGTLEDVIEILVDDGFSPREIRTWSGGENKLLKYLVRIAFAILQAERSGRGLKVLILDEAVDALDDDKTNDFMGMVMGLPKYFNQVFIISHNARILSEIPCRVKFERLSLANPCKVTVSTPGS